MGRPSPGRAGGLVLISARSRARARATRGWRPTAEPGPTGPRQLLPLGYRRRMIKVWLPLTYPGKLTSQSRGHSLRKSSSRMRTRPRLLPPGEQSVRRAGVAARW